MLEQPDPWPYKTVPVPPATSEGPGCDSPNRARVRPYVREGRVLKVSDGDGCQVSSATSR